MSSAVNNHDMVEKLVKGTLGFTKRLEHVQLQGEFS